MSMRRYLRALRRLWWAVGLSILLFAVAAVATRDTLLVRSTRYRATTVLLADGVTGPPSSTAPWAWALWGGNFNGIGTLQTLASLRPVMKSAAAKVGSTPDAVQ